MANNSMKPVAHLRPKRKTRARLSKVGNARDTIAGFSHDMDVCGLTYGQFSLIDLIQAALEITGAADVVICTWSAGFYDIEAAKNFASNGLIRSIRFVMDNGREKKGQAGVYNISDLFGEDSIRTARSHAKFVLIRNEAWNVVITSSMNLNKNIRLEQFEMTDDAERCGMFADFVDALWDELPAGQNHDRSMPGLPGLEGVEHDWGIEIGKIENLTRLAG